MKKIILLFNMILAAVMCSCIDDGFTTSPGDQPVFGTDTLSMGTVITGDGSVTRRLTLRNPNGKGVVISDLRLTGRDASMFRINVDGFAGQTFAGVEIRGNDSIYILVDCTLPPNGVTGGPARYEAALTMVANGVTTSLPIVALGQDVTRLEGALVTADTRFTADRPYRVMDSLVVAPGATLTLDPGAQLMFHDGAYMRVYGTLVGEGTPSRRVDMRGDRTSDVITGIPFDLMSRQWQGVAFMPGSHARLSHTDVRNTWVGVVSDGAALELVNCRLRNSAGSVLTAYDGSIDATGCEMAEAGGAAVHLEGGDHRMVHCTLANYYLFSAIQGPLLSLAHLDEASDNGSGQPYTRLLMANSVLYGLCADIAPGNLDGTAVRLDHCLLKSAGSDDDNFTSCVWDADPLFNTVRNDYIFDYRVREDSPAIGAGAPGYVAGAALTDMHGVSRSAGAPVAGAYATVGDFTQK